MEIGARIALFFSIFLSPAMCQTLDNYRDSLKNLLDSYERTTSIIPKRNRSSPMEVTMNINMAAINDIDMVNGYLEISGFLSMTWTQESYTETSPDIEYMVPSSQIWKPPLLLVNTVNDPREIGNKDSKIRYTVATRKCYWKPWVILRASCDINIRYYPFDKQTCFFLLTPWGHTASEIKLNVTNGTWSKDFFEPMEDWDVDSTKATAYVSDSMSFIKYEMTLKRKPDYLFISLIIPLASLAAVTILVFVLPNEAGERAGYSSTCFLAYMVFLETIMGNLPPTTMCMLTWYVLGMLLITGGMVISAVISIRLYYSKENSLFGLVFKYVFCWFNLTNLGKKAKCRERRFKPRKCCKVKCYSSSSSSDDEYATNRMNNNLNKTSLRNREVAGSLKPGTFKPADHGVGESSSRELSTEELNAGESKPDKEYEENQNMARIFDIVMFVVFAVLQCLFGVLYTHQIVWNYIM